MVSEGFHILVLECTCFLFIDLIMFLGAYAKQL